MNREEFVENALKIFDEKKQIFRKRLAKEELSKCGISMPNVEYIVDQWCDFNALMLRADSEHFANLMFLDLDLCERDKLAEFAGIFYDMFD